MRNPLLPRGREGYRLAEKLRQLRSLRGLTQREVAQVAGIDESTVRSYELARRMPKPEHVRSLAAALEVMPEALIPFDPAADHNELFLMTVELADIYGFEFGYNDDFAYIAPTRDVFIQGIGRWAKANEAMCKNEGRSGATTSCGRTSSTTISASGTTPPPTPTTILISPNRGSVG